MAFNTSKLLSPVIALVFLACVACGGNDTNEAPQAEMAPSTSASSTQVESDPSPDISIPAEVAFAAQIAQSLIGDEISEADQECLFTAAIDNEEFAEAIASVLDQNAAFTPTYFKSLITNVRDCVGQQRMSDAIALGLSLNEQNPELSACLNEIFLNDSSENTFLGMAAITAGIGVPPESAAQTIEALNTCVSIDVIASQLALQYEQLQSFQKAVNQDCLVDELNDYPGIDNFWEAAFVTQNPQQLEGISQLVELCEEPLFADYVQEIPESFVPWSGQRTLTTISPLIRNALYEAPPPNSLSEAKEYEATIITNDGAMTFELYADKAPLTVNNFVSLSRDGFYDGLTFHRVLEGFMAQGGDPTGIGTGSPGYRFEDEIDPSLVFDARGILAMANSGPDTNGSQFFITFAAASHLDGNYSIFGKLIEGDNVLSDIDLRDPANPANRGQKIIEVRIQEK
jgi:cyclophilin family peptidyl-prolyl cis-trans isomerase